MCLDDQILNTYLDGELAEPFKSQVEEHLSYCSSCRSRYNSLKKLSEKLKECSLSDDEIKGHQDRVLAMIDKNYLSKKKKKNFLRKEFKFNFTQVVGAAAAFAIIFVGSLTMVGKGKHEIIPVPDVSTAIDYSKIKDVRATDNQTTAKSLESYSLDEILKSLDARGYEVDVRIKGIKPIFSTVSSDMLIASYSDGTYVTKDGIAYDKDGAVLYENLTVNENGEIFNSDGELMFSDLEAMAN